MIPVTIVTMDAMGVGKPIHKQAQCPFKAAKCHNCGQIGHINHWKSCKVTVWSITLHVKYIIIESTDSMIPYFRDQTPHLISGRPRIIAAPPEGLNEINAALV